MEEERFIEVVPAAHHDGVDITIHTSIVYNLELYSKELDDFIIACLKVRRGSEKETFDIV